MNNCKGALSNLIASERVLESDNPYEAFSEGVLNFVRHYCRDDHASSWCRHVKVKKIVIFVYILYSKIYKAQIYRIPNSLTTPTQVHIFILYVFICIIN